MNYKNILIQGKNSPRPQHYGCGSRIILGAENDGSKASRKVSLKGEKLSTLLQCAQPLQPLQLLLQLWEQSGVHVSY